MPVKTNQHSLGKHIYTSITHKIMIQNPDEIVLEDLKMFHLESMNEQALWIGCYTKDGKIYHLNISGDQLKYYWSDETP